MKGVIFALLGGACITLQGVANARISQDIGTWQAATITQLTGFMIALIILLIVRDGHFRGISKGAAALFSRRCICSHYYFQ